MEDKSLTNLIDNYKMSNKEHQAILEKLKKKLFFNKKIERNPSIMFVIGQPGCGKTTFIKKTNFSNYTIINSDDYRRLSKYSAEIINKYSTYYAKLTNFDAHLWGDELFDYAVKTGYSVLREKTPVDYGLLDLIKKTLSGYPVIINVVVAGNLSSLIVTRERYESDILKSKDAKLSDVGAHNKCYNILPNFISKCRDLNIKLNYVVATENGFETIPVEDDWLTLLWSIRKKSNEQTCINFKERIDIIKKIMVNRNAPQEQFDELAKIENIFLMEKQ